MENNQDNKIENFITKIIDNDNQNEKWGKRVHTRFPPEPNGYLHIGHAKSICLNFGVANQYSGKCNLRFDDTNPLKENESYIDAIIEDVKWLGFKWSGEICFASDYFEQMYKHAIALIKSNKAYVCDLSSKKIKDQRGTLKSPGMDSPYRERDIKVNLELFTKMKDGLFEDGSKTLRAKIDMNHPNLNMRDPVMYRILNAVHHNTGDEWCIYPMYDWAHGIEDSIEQITHSICTLEFEDHRPLYNWYLKTLGINHPQQIEFARLNLNYTILSKCSLKTLVERGIVRGWDDPRMPTISGLRRRGYTPASIRTFSELIGVTKRDSIVEVAKLENILRLELNKIAFRRMVVLNPLKVIITNYPATEIEYLDGINNPEEYSSGSRKIPLSREIYIEKDDFIENPPEKFFRLTLGSEVRLKYAYFIKCNNIIKNNDGSIKEIHCTYDIKTKSGSKNVNRKVKGTIHWVSCIRNVSLEVHLYDRLFNNENPNSSENFIESLNDSSLDVIPTAYGEESLIEIESESHYQFERIGYFKKDIDIENTKKIVMNRSVTLRDSWKK